MTEVVDPETTEGSAGTWTRSQLARWAAHRDRIRHARVLVSIWERRAIGAAERVKRARREQASIEQRLSEARAELVKLEAGGGEW